MGTAMPLVRFAASLVIVAALAGEALAGASGVPADFRPDPALKTASRGELQSRIQRSCSVVQSRLQSVPVAQLSRPCACYASRTLRAFTDAELQAYRDTGLFNETARDKALAAIDACNLRRPV
jgi:hypothetical protein